MARYNRNIDRFNENVEYSKYETIESPKIYTFASLKNQKYRNESYWLHIPDEVMKNIGIRVSMSDMDVKVVLIKKTNPKYDKGMMVKND